MDLKEIGINTRNWVDQAQDSDCWIVLVNAAFNLRVPYAMELVSYTFRRLRLKFVVILVEEIGVFRKLQQEFKLIENLMKQFWQLGLPN